MKKYKPGAIRTPIFFKKEEIKCSCEIFKLKIYVNEI